MSENNNEEKKPNKFGLVIDFSKFNSKPLLEQDIPLQEESIDQKNTLNKNEASPKQKNLDQLLNISGLLNESNDQSSFMLNIHKNDIDDELLVDNNFYKDINNINNINNLNNNLNELNSTPNIAKKIELSNNSLVNKNLNNVQNDNKKYDKTNISSCLEDSLITTDLNLQNIKFNEFNEGITPNNKCESPPKKNKDPSSYAGMYQNSSTGKNKTFKMNDSNVKNIDLLLNTERVNNKNQKKYVKFLNKFPENNFNSNKKVNSYAEIMKNYNTLEREKEKEKLIKEKEKNCIPESIKENYSEDNFCKNSNSLEISNIPFSPLQNNNKISIKNLKDTRNNVKNNFINKPKNKTVDKSKSTNKNNIEKYFQVSELTTRNKSKKKYRLSAENRNNNSTSFNTSKNTIDNSRSNYNIRKVNSVQSNSKSKSKNKTKHNRNGHRNLNNYINTSSISNNNPNNKSAINKERENNFNNLLENIKYKYKNRENKFINQQNNMKAEIEILREKLKTLSVNEALYKVEIEKLKRKNINNNSVSNSINSTASKIQNKKNNNITSTSKKEKNFGQKLDELISQHNDNSNLSKLLNIFGLDMDLFEGEDENNFMDNNENYVEILEKYPGLKKFIGFLSEKYKNEKEYRLKLEEKTVEIFTNDMKTINNLENKIKKLQKEKNSKISNNINNSFENNFIDNNTTRNSFKSCDNLI